MALLSRTYAPPDRLENCNAMSTAIHANANPAIEYPDSDGEPMADNTLQFKWIVLIKENLEAIFLKDPNVFVAGDLLWYPVEGNPKIRMAPDALVPFGRPKGRRGSYKHWEEGHVAPQVVFETLSPGNRPAEMAQKFIFYERYGVEEYYIYDPDSGDFEGWIRKDGRFVKVKNVFGFVSPRLGIRFEPGPGPDNLKIYGPDGRLFETQYEVIGQRNAAEKRAASEHRRAEAARKRADKARERAESERQRANRLAAKLRELGIEPD
jgi:Uma2 family endonuclease